MVYLDLVLFYSSSFRAVVTVTCYLRAGIWTAGNHRGSHKNCFFSARIRTVGHRFEHVKLAKESVRASSLSVTTTFLEHCLHW